MPLTSILTKINFMNKIKTNSKNKIKVIKIFTIYKEEMCMIKQIAWNTFKNTGDINTFLELLEVENMEKNMINGEENNGNIQNKRNNNTRK